jgi:hypothetical protein
MINYFPIAFIAAFLSCASVSRTSALKNQNDDCRSMSHVTQITQKYSAGMNALYNERLKTNPDVKGRIVVVFYVQASGLITQPPIIESSSLGDTVLENQFIGYIKTWDYGACDSRKKTMQIIYPFDFNTRSKI